MRALFRCVCVASSAKLDASTERLIERLARSASVLNAELALPHALFNKLSYSATASISARTRDRNAFALDASTTRPPAKQLFAASVSRASERAKNAAAMGSTARNTCARVAPSRRVHPGAPLAASASF